MSRRADRASGARWVKSELETEVLDKGMAVDLRAEADEICDLVLSVGLKVGEDLVSGNGEGRWLLPLARESFIAQCSWHGSINHVAPDWEHGRCCEWLASKL